VHGRNRRLNRVRSGPASTQCLLDQPETPRRWCSGSTSAILVVEQISSPTPMSAPCVVTRAASISGEQSFASVSGTAHQHPSERNASLDRSSRIIDDPRRRVPFVEDQ